MLANLSIAFSPLVPWPWLGAGALLAALVLALAWLRHARGVVWRALVLAVLLLTLANPSAVIEDRKPLDDIGLVVVDDSPSQGIGERRAQTEAALAAVEKAAKPLKHFELRVVRSTGQNPAELDSGTELYKALEDALDEIPRQRFAGAIMITDGQVHDAPSAQVAAELDAPLHVLLTGARNEADRRLTVVDAPSYGLVNKSLNLTVKVEDLPGPPQGQAKLTLRRDGGSETTVPIAVGENAKLPAVLDHAGQSVFELSVEPGPHSLTPLNKRAVVVINGVRDRLRVLLISGEPHPGERAWRNLLKSDPSVDLVHFTILRPPEKLDATPVRELSLITFPVHELFDVKLNEFDLIIFDRYRRRGELPSNYLQNIADYVNRGGALLAAVGPDYASPISIYYTPLGAVMPAEPTGQILERGFRPELTEIGKHHPVTAALPGADDKKQPWGRWFRQVEARVHRGTALMSGDHAKPLLVLDRVGKGRVAQLLSDQMWLWARGFEGGGPQAEVLRRLAYWLMKEPDLEENDLRAAVEGDRLVVTRQSLEPDDRPVTVMAPDGTSASLALTPDKGGRSTGSLVIAQMGLYRVSDGSHTALAAAGPLNPVEFADVRTTADKLGPVAQASGGGVFWVGDRSMPDIRRVSPGRAASGHNWLGVRENGDYLVTGFSEVPLFPALAALLLTIGLLLAAWRREGR